MIKMAKIDTLFMTKTAEKPYPLRPHINSPYKGVPLPHGPGVIAKSPMGACFVYSSSRH